jgi:uncharacterized protein (DUF3820 family)
MKEFHMETDEHRLLIELANYRMPFGKYKDRLLVDLPEAYLLWFKEKGFPENKLGFLLENMLEIKLSGSAGLLRPLIKK